MSLHAGQEKEISQVQIIIAKVTLERAQYVSCLIFVLFLCHSNIDMSNSAMKAFRW